MREFFRGWRRKTGCVTLVMACWIWSLLNFAHVNFVQAGYVVGGERRAALLASVNDGLLCVVASGTEVSNKSPSHFQLQPGWHINDIPPFDYDYFGLADTDWKREYWGGHVSIAKSRTGNFTETKLLVPDVTLILALTLLSAFLLLSRPRKSIPKKITDPVPTEGA